MNWSLIFKLSLFGLAMALGTVYFIPSNVEPFCWVVIFIICAYFIAKYCTARFFQHGFMVSIFNCVWITAIHILLFKTYLSWHPKEAEMMTHMPLPDSPRLMMLLTGPVIGVITGLVQGLFAYVASKSIER
ncbi:hypothetical protein FHW36_105309 [Chitinophaga polysaccharea]|uniref:Uncharacterized protein n=1 Tax=Chitinophaga polysaccharea TaxID=1293035 RepID=A0A561PP40_9BACT|nr:hypothetical protein [Chitinophaga polysaccharea]TWF39869.1 hypothetical protein FHW36_105309 [Chitinophaga polysaccharea]